MEFTLSNLFGVLSTWHIFALLLQVMCKSCHIQNTDDFFVEVKKKKEKQNYTMLSFEITQLALAQIKILVALKQEGV